MAKKVFGIDTKAGIQRDGTLIDKQNYNDGEWVRFQRGRPRKIGGYREMTGAMNGYSRGIYVDSNDGYNRIFNGYNNGIEVFTCDNNGIGAGIVEYSFGGEILTKDTLVGGTAYTNGTYTNTALTGGSGSMAKATIVVAGNTVTTVTITNGGSGYVVGNILSAVIPAGSGFTVRVATIDTHFVQSDLNVWQFDGFFDATGNNNNILLAHPGQNLNAIDNTINTTVLAGDTNGSLMYPLQDSQGTSPTNDYVDVSGGVVALHPYVFVYGDNGLIKNSSAGNAFDWNSPDTNEVNVSSQKIVKGLPLRGGSNAPSGLFWALDSLIKVSYAPTQISTGSVIEQLYWKYDIIGNSSILSSQSVIEYDGIYYWCGVDRFLLYQGVIKEVPNAMNQNWFFDNLNYAQRQKVWATKVPRYGEIWWFYPRGDATECTDAIIFNVREQTWYDAGSSPGATRTAGYFSQVFHYPTMAGADLSVSTPLLTQNITTTNSSSVISTPISAVITTDLVVAGSGVQSGSIIVSVAPGTAGNYSVTLSKTCTASATVSASFSTQADKISLWQHEIGTDAVIGQSQNAIFSMFETSDIGFVTGGPVQSSLMGDNFWMHIERVEPDFIQSGDMSLYIIGKPYAQAEDQVSGAYTFSPDTHKIDMREQRRELRLKFISNVEGGDYQLGVLLLSVTFGDTRGY
jgi:hypothetical protein